MRDKLELGRVTHECSEVLVKLDPLAKQRLTLLLDSTVVRGRDHDGTDLANMLLEAGNAVATEHEPDFE